MIFILIIWVLKYPYNERIVISNIIDEMLDPEHSKPVTTKMIFLKHKSQENV